MATKVEDRFEQQKTYETFESDAKAAGLYDTFDAKDLERAKTDVDYGYGLLNDKKGWKAAEAAGDKEGMEYYAGLGQARRDSHDAKYSPQTSKTGTPTYSGALAAIQAYDKTIPGDKSSKYLTMIDSLLSNISKDKFSYDAKNDPRYALAEEYAQRAMENQMAESAILTGGYGNSYAAAAGQQVYTEYMNDAVNDMENRAYDRWSAERDNNYNLLGIAQGLEQQAYNRAETERQWQYQAEKDAKAEADTKQTNAQNIVYDYIMTTGGIEGLSDEELATTGWSEAYINSLITKAQNARAPVVNEPAFTAEQALSYYVGGNRSEKVQEAMLYYFGKDYAENAETYYKNMTAQGTKLSSGSKKTETVEVSDYQTLINLADSMLSGGATREELLDMLIDARYGVDEDGNAYEVDAKTIGNVINGLAAMGRLNSTDRIWLENEAIEKYE